MAKISLRYYFQEIDRIIATNRIDEAIAHSRHILQTYSRCIAVYRLLGKAYSEGKRYSDAADIFQRVLSSIPEDEVSHIGMSIIREDEGNLNDAHWHMQMAFEVDPSNSVIQDELRRLVGKREGIEPPRIRLTRGALARMYIKGDLVQEAVSELRIALGEDPNRLDLKVLLANSLARLGQRVEAIEISNQILRKLPNCLDPNRILAELLAGTERDAEAKEHRQIVCSLDPYYSFVTLSTPVVEQVPDQAISIERLDWKLGQPQPGIIDQPVWASTLGIDMSAEPGTAEAMPDWLAINTEVSLEDEQPDTAPEKEPSSVIFQPQMAEPEVSEIFSDIEIEEAKESEDLPEWMIETGWKPVSDLQSQPASEATDKQISGGDAEEEKLDQSEIPDWLKGLAIAETTAEIFGKSEQPEAQTTETSEELPAWVFEQEPTYSTETNLPPWLAESPKDDLDQAIPVESDTKPDEGLPDWLFVEEVKQAATAEEKSQSELPDWLMEEADESKPSPVEDISSEEFPVNEIPSWLFEDTTTISETTADLESLPEVEGVYPRQLFSNMEGAEGEAIDKESEATFEQEPSLEHPLAGLTLPAWLLTNQSRTEASAADGSEIESLKPPIESPENIPGQSDLGSAEIVTNIPAWLLEDELGELPIEEEDTKPSKISSQMGLSSTQGDFQPEPTTEIPPVVGEEELSDRESISIQKVEVFGEPRAEEEDADLGWLVGLEVKDAVEEGLTFEPEEEGYNWEIPVEESAEPLPEWLLEEELQARIDSVSLHEEPAEEVIFTGGPEIDAQMDIGKTDIVPSLAEAAEGTPADSSEATEQTVEEREMELPDWLFVAVSETGDEVEWSPPPILPASKFDINSATMADLERLPGVDAIRAQNILKYKENNGPFKDLNELSQVPGITTDIVDQIRQSAYVEMPTLESASSGEFSQEKSIFEAEPPALAKARTELLKDNLVQGLAILSQLIEANQDIPEVIQDLKTTLEKSPDNAGIWQLLGDAFLRADQTQEALNAYRQAEKLLI